MPEYVECKGYTIITSLSHGLLGPLKTRLDALSRMSGSSQIFTGAAPVLAGFPSPEKTILAVGCTRPALFDEDTDPEDQGYRHLFGDRVMVEVQAYVDQIPPKQVCFRDENEAPGNSRSQLQRIAKVFADMGIQLTTDETNNLARMLTD
jgi:hypothetical protein